MTQIYGLNSVNQLSQGNIWPQVNWVKAI